MEVYVRPTIATPTYRDADGQPISYGQQWRDREGRQPPEDSYSVDRHPERFLPLHAVADALVAHLVASYDVRVQRPAPPAEPGGITTSVTELRSVHLVPADPDAAPLTIRWLSYPSIETGAGVFSRGVHPDCGCEACDETWEPAADALEREVLAWVEGRTQEGVERRGLSWWTRTSTVDAEGGRVSGSATNSNGSRAWLRQVRGALDARPRGWQPWPRRDGPANRQPPRVGGTAPEEAS